MVRYFDNLLTEEILSQRRFSIRAILVQGDGRRGAAANRLSPQLDSSRGGRGGSAEELRVASRKGDCRWEGTTNLDIHFRDPKESIDLKSKTANRLTRDGENCTRSKV